jgi:hypothetical protein
LPRHSTSVLWSCRLSCSIFTVFLCIRIIRLDRFGRLLFFAIALLHLCSVTLLAQLFKLHNVPAYVHYKVWYVVVVIATEFLPLFSVVLSAQLFNFHCFPAHAHWFENLPNLNICTVYSSVEWYCWLNLNVVLNIQINYCNDFCWKQGHLIQTRSYDLSPDYGSSVWW